MRQHPRIYILMMILVATIFAIPLGAAYLTDMPATLKQPDGTTLQCFTSGDEYHNWLHDKNHFTIIQSPTTGYYVYAVRSGSDVVAGDVIVGQVDPASRGLTPNINISEAKYKSYRQNKFQMPAERDAPTTGTINNIVVYIRFSDETEFAQTISTYDGWFNSGTSSLKSYFAEASYSQLNVNTTFYPASSGGYVVSWQDSHARAYFQPYNATTNTIGYQTDTESTSREFTLLQNAIAGVASAVPTSLVIDADNDGKVDNVVFIIRGAAGGWSDLLWPHRWSIYDRTVTLNGKRVYDFNLQLQDFLTSSSVGVICHEFFHTLGAPDLYHYTSNGISPAGSWDLMENNTNPPQHMGAYMKWKYGDWIASIPTISIDQAYTLNPLTSSTGNAYRINSPNSSTEYFIVEFRKKTGTFESSIPGSGMLVYRINTTAGDGNADGPPDEVYIYRPGGTSSVNGTISSAYFSSESGRTEINATTNPTPFLTSGDEGKISLFNIGSSAGSTMSFSYVSLAEAIDFSTNPYTQTFDDAAFPPEGWTTTAITGTYAFERVTSGTYPTASPQSGAGMAQYNSYSATSGNTAILATPRINIANITSYNYSFSFYMYRDNGYLTNADKIEVYRNTTADLSGSPVLIGTVNRSINLAPIVASTGWYQYNYSLAPGATGNYYLIFKATSAWGNRMFLDSFSMIRESSATVPNVAINPSPANAATNIAITTNLDWSSGGGSPLGYRLSLGTNNPPSNIVNNTNLGAVTTYNPVADLQYSTTYYWKITPYNAIGDAAYCPVWSFTTTLDPTQPVPYAVDFNSSTTLPANWAGTFVITTNHGTSGSNGLTKNIYSSDPTASMTTCPIGPLGANNELLFDYRIVNYTGYPATATTLGASDKVEVQISTDGTNFSTIYTINQASHLTSAAFVLKKVDLTAAAKAAIGSVVYVKFLATWGAGDYYVDIDNITVQAKPVNPIFAITPTTADFGALENGTTSSPLTFTITNNGSGNLTIAKESITITGTDAASFVLSPVATDISLAASATANISVSFHPTSVGTKTATLNLTDNTSSKALQTVNLSGRSTLSAGIPYADGFESGWGDWVVVNSSQINQWYVGTATANHGVKAAYISNDAGVTNSYTITSASVSHIYRDINIPVGITNIKLKFAWKGNGEGTTTLYDYMKVYLVDKATVPVAGTLLADTPIGTTYLLNGDIWQEVTINLDDAIAGTAKRLVFTWRNDGSVGTQPPVAIDDVRLVTGSTTDASIVVDGNILITPPAITLPDTSVINPYVSITGLNPGSTDVVTVTSSYSEAAEGLINTGLTFNLAGTSFGGSTITITHNLGFIPVNIAYRILPGQNWMWIGNPGDWTATEVYFTVAVKADGDIEVVFPNEDGATLPFEGSLLTANINALHTVTLNWVTQTESNLQGYYVMRAESRDFATAAIVSPMIEAQNTSTETSYNFTDNEVNRNITYFYWIQGMDMQGTSTVMGPVSITLNADPELPIIPVETALQNAYPNPFNPQTTLRYSMKTSGDVKIDIYNMKGQLIRSYNATHQNPGYYSVVFDGKDLNGRSVSSGVYYYRMISGKYSSTKKMIMMK